MEDVEPDDQLRPFVDAERQFVACTAAEKPEEAVRCLENVLREEQETVKQMQDTVLSTLFERLALGYNTLGMKNLKEGNTDVSCKFFEKAEALTDPANLHMNTDSRLVLRAVTYNNMGCFYKSVGKLHTALGYLRKAEKIEERTKGRCQNPAGTHLNLCALLSQMGKHNEALQHAHKALQELDAAKAAGEAAGGSGESLVAVAYFNMGAEYEHLRKQSEALWAYEQAHASCEAELGPDHPLSRQISDCLDQLRKRSKGRRGGG